MATKAMKEPDPALLILREGGRTTIDLHDVDCALICSAMKLQHTLRAAGNLIGWRGEDTPHADAREAALLKMLEVKPR